MSNCHRTQVLMDLAYHQEMKMKLDPLEQQNNSICWIQNCLIPSHTFPSACFRSFCSLIWARNWIAIICLIMHATKLNQKTHNLKPFKFHIPFPVTNSIQIIFNISVLIYFMFTKHVKGQLYALWIFLWL